MFITNFQNSAWINNFSTDYGLFPKNETTSKPPYDSLFTSALGYLNHKKSFYKGRIYLIISRG